MQRLINHWTAGTYEASRSEREHYHFLIEGDGTIIKGLLPISANESTADGEYAAHTFRCNKGSIGVSLCCMLNAKEIPFRSGKYPMTKIQWDVMVKLNAKLCKQYRIAVTPTTVLSHAEVQKNLRIPQNGKWDFSRLSFDPSVIGARACGDKLRAEVLREIRK